MIWNISNLMKHVIPETQKAQWTPSFSNKETTQRNTTTKFLKTSDKDKIPKIEGKKSMICTEEQIYRWQIFHWKQWKGKDSGVTSIKW